MGGERGVSQDFPDEHHWWIIAWVIFDCKSFLVLTYSLALWYRSKYILQHPLEALVSGPKPNLLVETNRLKTLFVRCQLHH